MFEDKNTSKTPLVNLGEFKLIDHLTQSVKPQNKSTVLGIGDDAAIIDHSNNKTLISTDLLLEGLHFDLSYMPLKHLGYTVEALEELYTGINLACKNYKVDLVGGDTTSSTSGLMLSLTAIGNATQDRIVKRSGAQEHDLLVVSGDLGAAYTGLQVLEREKAVFKVNPNSQPDLTSYSYSIERQLKPEARKDIIELLEELDIISSSFKIF
jgi:thiamine-monophosphate kinase